MISTNWIADSVIISVLLIYIIFKVLTRNFDYWDKKGIPYIKPVPLFGNFFESATYKVDIGECLRRLYRLKDAPYFGIWVFNTPHLIIKCPDLIKAILVKDFNYFSDRTVTSDESADSVASNFLFLAKNPEWKNVRCKMTPVFTGGKLKNMIPLMSKAGESMKDYISKKCIDKSSVECKELCAKFSTDVLVSTAFGIEANCFSQENSEFRIIGRKMFDYNLLRAFKTFCYFFAPSMVSMFKMQFFENDIYNFLRTVFWDTIKERESNGSNRNDLIDAIIQMKNDNTNFVGDKVVAQAIQFYAAGFETTSSTMAFTLYELCIHTEIQNKLRIEINAALKEHGSISYESINSMKYLHMVVSETLRKYPVLPFLDRRCLSDYKIPGSKFIIEKGTPVYIPMLGLHMDESYFPNPDLYDPERFNEERIKTIQPYSYIPFGEGPHNCIGARFGLLVSKFGLVSVLSEFQVEKNDLTPIPIKFDPKSFVMQSITGLPMKFKKVISEAA